MCYPEIIKHTFIHTNMFLVQVVSGDKLVGPVEASFESLV